MNIGPPTVLRTPEVADGIGGGGESAPKKHREGFVAGKGPVMGDVFVADLY